jgi:hypothetical protein
VISKVPAKLTKAVCDHKMQSSDNPFINESDDRRARKGSGRVEIWGLTRTKIELRGDDLALPICQIRVRIDRKGLPAGV